MPQGSSPCSRGWEGLQAGGQRGGRATSPEALTLRSSDPSRWLTRAPKACSHVFIKRTLIYWPHVFFCPMKTLPRKYLLYMMQCDSH